MTSGCTVCWLVDPYALGSVAVLYDGNGYCIRHWKDVLVQITQHAERETRLPSSTEMPLVLAGWPLVATILTSAPATEGSSR